MGDDFDLPTTALARSALMNVNGLVKIAPELERYLMFQTARSQLQAICERLESEETQVPA